ncbi:MAG TPA: hypothetical protein VMT43_05825 [Acidimicrobiales bacterium]|nr:hypothetical protein [Acidimicrobiales bacterium]
MSAIDHDELTEMMQLLASDDAAVIAFVAVYADRLRAVVRGHLRRLARPDHVRQIDRRVRPRLGELAATDEKFAALADLPWVTGARREASRCLAGEVAA